MLDKPHLHIRILVIQHIDAVMVSTRSDTDHIMSMSVGQRSSPIAVTFRIGGIQIGGEHIST